MSEPSAPSVIRRVVDLLRVLAPRDQDGLSTSEIARAAKLARPTAHRLLTSLVAEGMLDRDEPSGRWHLGPELYLLGAAAAPRYSITRHARDSVGRLAAQTGESAFLSLRRGEETVCLLREDGAFPIRSFVLYEGVRFPLGVVSAGLVILAFLPDREIDQYLDRADLASTFGPTHSEKAIRERIELTRSLGYAVNPGLIVQGSWGMAAAVFDVAGRPASALTLTGIDSRFGPDRQPYLGRLLLDEAHQLSRRLGA